MKVTGLSHARFAHEYGWSLDAVRLYLSPSATAPIPLYMERALIKEEGWHAIDLLIAGKGKRASKYALKAIRTMVQIGTKPPERRRAKRKPRKVNFLAPRFLSPSPPPPAPRDPLAVELDVLATRVAQDAADALRARFAARRPRGPGGRPADDGDAPPKTRVTDPI